MFDKQKRINFYRGSLAAKSPEVIKSAASMLADRDEKIETMRNLLHEISTDHCSFYMPVRLHMSVCKHLAEFTPEEQEKEIEK